ncbi:MAG: hypothetical protein KAH22_07070 [Thiotrichaceae bacterium]|nr:hypothetical protein [Thiotrichaceae bacterium]
MEIDKKMTDEMLFEESIVLLKQAFIRQSHVQRSVSRRVKVLIRSIMVAIVTSLLFTSYLAYILTKEVNALSNKLDKITFQGALLQKDMNKIDVVLTKFQAQMSYLPDMKKAVDDMDTNLYQMLPKMKLLTSSMEGVTGDVSKMSLHLQGVSNAMQHLNQTMGRIDDDVHQASKPIQRFNDMNPFNFFN